MELIRGAHAIQPHHQGGVVTLGNFDGVHLGHQSLLQQTKAAANALKTHAIVLTFEPHPVEYFMKITMAPRLMRFREKWHALAQSEMDYALILKFDEALANLPARTFIETLLIEKLKVKQVIVGEDYHFGKNREGDVALLKSYSAFTTQTIPPFLVDGERVSSSRVRRALMDNDFALSERLLGRSYRLEGRVIYGNQRGRIIGFPTANIYLHRQSTPVQGVYIVRMHGVSDRALPGVANLGIRPTVDGTRSLLEVHLFDFHNTIYGAYVSVEFCQKIRDEKRFESMDLLKEQIMKDAEIARHYFKQTGELS